ncbi:MAG: exodeoxyribonuclease VII large subunit [Oscillospiraceae bacterium]|jgi:exodeoxyribonuclease VII large subunit|nr:exodeoxyribonuclease VII large subunit [Oscillospiraceae bacterium]
MIVQFLNDLKEGQMKISLLTVSSLNNYVKSLLEQNEYLQNVLVVGEISNFKNHYSSGHLYFSLKDKASVVKCVMFKTFTKNLRFELADGMSIVARGRISIYEQTGQYQFYVEDMQPEGAGSLNLAFERLKEKLKKEGLFDESNKKVIPNFAQKIGVITSETGSVFHDILQVLKRRFPLAEVLFFPVPVQGKTAASAIASVIFSINVNYKLDVLIIGRGGGSVEELWPFNEEILARAIFSCKTPVVSAVGHETDFTICDFVSDLRAPTPSAAAELVVPDQNEIFSRLTVLLSFFERTLVNVIEFEKQNIENLMLSKFLQNTSKILQEELILLELNLQKIHEKTVNKIYLLKENLTKLASRIDVLSPLKILKMGYAIPEKNSNLVRSIDDVSEKDEIDLRVIDGKIACMIISKEKLA